MKKYILIASFFCNVIFLILGIRHFMVMPVQNKHQQLSFFTNRDKILKDLPKESTDIIFFGDSEIQGYEVSEYFNSLSVKNRGIYYDSSEGLLFRSVDVAKGNPNKVFIEIGLNDLQNGTELSTITQNVTKAIDLITANGHTKVYLLSVLPTVLVDEAKRLSLNKKFAKAASGKNKQYVDLDPYFANHGLMKIYDVGDKIHLNAAGYSKLSEILAHYIK